MGETLTWMRMRSPHRLQVTFACMLVSAFCTACAGGGNGGPVAPSPSPSPVPATVAVAPGAMVAMQGYTGGTFTFTFSGGAPPGETFTAASVPNPMYPPCQGTGCAAVLHPVDSIRLSAGPAALALSTIGRVTFSGFGPSGGTYRFDLTDETVDEGETWFSAPASGGALTETFTVPTGAAPIVALQPGRTYIFSVWP